MKYGTVSEQKAKEFAKAGRIFYGCAYQINDNDLSHTLMQKPIKGIFVNDGYDTNFVPVKKDGTPRKSGGVWRGSRHVADTYEECVEIFNDLVDKRKQKLQELIKECDETLIKP